MYCCLNFKDFLWLPSKNLKIFKYCIPIWTIWRIRLFFFPFYCCVIITKNHRYNHYNHCLYLSFHFITPWPPVSIPSVHFVVCSVLFLFQYTVYDFIITFTEISNNLVLRKSQGFLTVVKQIRIFYASLKKVSRQFECQERDYQIVYIFTHLGYLSSFSSQSMSNQK